MRKKQMSLMDPAEAVVVEQITLRRIEPAEQERWDQLIIQYHYLKSAHLVGERLCYVAEYQGQWLALLGGRRRPITSGRATSGLAGMTTSGGPACRWWPTTPVFCLLTAPGQYPNLASRVLALNGARLSQDWQEAYGHPILLVESFVDTQLFRGTAYKAAGWQALGQSAGFKRVAEDFYEAHDRPKQLYGRELVKHAARKLRQRQLPEPLQAYERQIEPSCQMPGDQLTGLWQVLHRQVSESRSGKGLRHKAGHRADDHLCLSAQRRPGRAPGGGLLCAGLDAHATGGGALLVQSTHPHLPSADGKLYLQSAQSGAGSGISTGPLGLAAGRHGAQDGSVVVLDGKALRGSQGTQLVGAINEQSGRTLGVQAVADKSNEIAAAQTLLGRLQLDGAIALMDALHTQVQTARSIVQEGGGDFVLFVKGNQAGLLKQAQHFLPEDFSPSTAASRARPRPD